MLDHGKASAVGRAGSITLRCHPRHRAPEDCLGNKDRDDIIDSLSSIFRDARMACYGWALMSNHAHFLCRADDVGLSTSQKRAINSLNELVT